MIPNKCLFYLFLNTSCTGDSTALQNNPSQYLITFMFTFFPTGYPKSFLLQFKPITSCSTCTRLWGYFIPFLFTLNFIYVKNHIISACNLSLKKSQHNPNSFHLHVTFSSLFTVLGLLCVFCHWTTSLLNWTEQFNLNLAKPSRAGVYHILLIRFPTVLVR